MSDVLRSPTGDERALHERAREAAGRAYVPYSGFRVGAALRCSDGTIVTGCNVENASFSLTICAERTALVRAIAEGRPGPYEAIAVGVEGGDGQPCGACRQVLVEFGPRMAVVFQHDGELVTARADGLLPARFDAEALER